MGNLKDVDAAYLAGIIDGEGHVSVNKVTPNDQNIPNYRGVVGITNTDPGIMKWIQEIVPECFVTFVKKKNVKWKDTYVINFSQSVLLWLLPELIPYLRIKRHRAELVLNLLQLKLDKSRNTLEEQDVIKQEIYNQNRKGKAYQLDQQFFATPKAKTCSYEGCSSAHYGNGYCRRHYRWIFESKTWQENRKRKCTECGNDMPEKARIDSKFCCLSCKMKWHRKHGSYSKGIAVKD